MSNADETSLPGCGLKLANLAKECNERSRRVEAPMMEIRTLEKPPIQEAIIEFGFGIQADESQLRAIASAVLNGRKDWKSQDAKTVEATFDLDGTESVKRTETFSGIRLLSPDGGMIATISRELVSASSVRSYTTWESLQSFALGLAAEYVKITGQRAVKKLSSRFINLIPIGDGGFAEILNEAPKSPIKGGVLSDFADRKVMTDAHGNRLVVLVGTARAGAESGIEIGRLAILVDTDVSSDVSFAFGSNEMVEILASLRLAKNQIFFSTIRGEVLK